MAKFSTVAVWGTPKLAVFGGKLDLQATGGPIGFHNGDGRSSEAESAAGAGSVSGFDKVEG